jgi:5-methyltetrahydropteroyltriglutamate--homocysteine methyltransferase
MFTATANLALATTITGSLPRPSWYRENLGTRTFLDAMVDARFREQYEDTLACFIRDQGMAGLDILTDGDCRFDLDVGGHAWMNYPTRRMAGFERDNPKPTATVGEVRAYPRGHILHDYLEARVAPELIGPVGPGDLQYGAVWKTAQRMTHKPVKFGTITPELLEYAARNRYYKDSRELIMAVSDAFNQELHALADAGCKVIQLEEPRIHMITIRGGTDPAITAEFMLNVFNNTVKGLRDKAEVWCHTCWGNPSAQRLFPVMPSYAPALEYLERLDADVITFETCSSGGRDIPLIGEKIKSKKIAIGVVDHHTLQVETPEEVATLVRMALKNVPPERLILTTDCGLGRDGMTRRHAFYKMVAIVRGANVVRKEIGLPEVPCLAADPRFSLVPVSA